MAGMRTPTGDEIEEARKAGAEVVERVDNVLFNLDPMSTWRAAAAGLHRWPWVKVEVGRIVQVVNEAGLKTGRWVPERSFHFARRGDVVTFNGLSSGDAQHLTWVQFLEFMLQRPGYGLPDASSKSPFFVAKGEDEVEAVNS